MFSSTDVAVRIMDIYPIAQREPLRPVPRATIRPLASEKPGSLPELDRSEAAIRRCEPEVRLVKSYNRVGLVRGDAAAAATGAVDAKQLLTDEIRTSKCRVNSVLSPVVDSGHRRAGCEKKSILNIRVCQQVHRLPISQG